MEGWYKEVEKACISDFLYRSIVQPLFHHSVTTTQNSILSQAHDVQCVHLPAVYRHSENQASRHPMADHYQAALHTRIFPCIDYSQPRSSITGKECYPQAIPRGFSPAVCHLSSISVSDTFADCSPPAG